MVDIMGLLNGGGLNEWGQNNQQMLLGLGAGLLSGEGWGAGAAGAMAGMQNDQRTRLIKQKEAEAAQSRLLNQQLAEKLGRPELAHMPEALAQLATRQPDKQSFEERQYNMLSPEQQAAYRQKHFLGGGDNDEIARAGQRAKIAQSLGMTPDHPAYQSYIATGKMPREDQAPLSATDKKAIMEADEGVMSAENAIASLNRAKELSKTAYDGPTAGVRGMVTGVFGSEGGQATTLLDNEVKNNALQSLKSIFGGNPTEGERAIMMEIQGSSSQPAAVREKIYEKARVLAERRLQFNRERAASLRGGSYYKPGQSQPGPAQQSAQSQDGSISTPFGTLRRKGP